MPFLFLAQDGDGGGTAGFLIFWIILIGGVFVFMSWRQRTRQRQRTQFLGSIEVGDEVRSIGGIIGIVESLDDEKAVLRTEDGVKIPLVRQAIAEKTPAEP